MDLPCSHFCGIQALLVLTIWSIISFSSKGDSGPLVLSPKKECVYPKIIGCIPCSQDNIMGPYFDAHKSLSNPDIRKILNQETCSGDFCEELNDNTEVFGLSSLHRQLIGEGSHRKLVTAMIFYNQPKFIHFVNKHFCQAVIVEYLPSGVFSDPFELQPLIRRKVFHGATVIGDTNLELPSALSNRSVVEIYFDVKNGTPEVVQLPLHARYPPLDYSSHATITIGKPDLFLRCGHKEDHKASACFLILIDLGFFNGSNTVTWRIPRGNEAHTTVVTIITYLSALVCSLLIVCLTSVLSQKEIKVA